MSPKSPLVIVIARICILDHETLSSRVHYCNGYHVLIKILLIRKPSMSTIHVNVKIYIYTYMRIKTIHVNLLLQLARALHTLQLTHHSRLSRQKLKLRTQDATVRKGCSLRSFAIFGLKKLYSLFRLQFQACSVIFLPTFHQMHVSSILFQGGRVMKAASCQ